MVSMLASTYHMDDDDTLPYLRVHLVKRTVPFQELTRRTQGRVRGTAGVKPMPDTSSAAQQLVDNWGGMRSTSKHPGM